MKVDGVRRAVGEVVTLPGAVDKLREAEEAEAGHAIEARRLASISRAAAFKAIPGLKGQVTEAERALANAERDLKAIRSELARVQALANVPGSNPRTD